MNRDEIRLRCRAVLGKFLQNRGELENVDNGGPLLDSSSFDSLSTINLLVELENTFGIRLLNDGDLERIFESLDSLVEHIETCLDAEHNE